MKELLMISNYLFTQKRLDKDGVSMDCEIYTWYVIHTLNILLKDRTTNNNNILLLSNSYSEANFNSQITKELLNSINFCPHYMKSKPIKNERKKKKAEVFTPVWICNKMINYYDEMWFDKKDVFNIIDPDGNTLEITGKYE